MPHEFQIVIDSQGWDTPPGSTVAMHIQDIHAVLTSCSDSLWKFCPNTSLDTIRVRRRRDYPQADFDRDAEGHIMVGLNSGGRLWSQFSFQFAHEFGHVLATQSNDPKRCWKNLQHANHWLEECLCETASLFALREMARVWQTHAPYPGEAWRDYSHALASYAGERLRNELCQLPKGQSFLAWFRENEPDLRKNPVNREKNTLIASQLLPLFEKEPTGWESLPFINWGERVLDKTLEKHLGEWRQDSLRAQQPFLESLSKVFGIG